MKINRTRKRDQADCSSGVRSEILHSTKERLTPRIPRHASRNEKSEHVQLPSMTLCISVLLGFDNINASQAHKYSAAVSS